jgi:flagellar biosynthesis regulator FlaF
VTGDKSILEDLQDSLHDPTMDEAHRNSILIHKNILYEAYDLVHNARSETYDHPLDNFGRTAKIWQVILEDIIKPGSVLTPEMVGLCQIGVKLAREVHLQKRDNLVDIAGYAEAIEWLKHEQVRRNASSKSLSLDSGERRSESSASTSGTGTDGNVPSAGLVRIVAQ